MPVVQKGGRFGIDVKYRIKCGWMIRRKASGVLCNKRTPIRLKGKFYRSVVRPIMLYARDGKSVTREIFYYYILYNI
jgi:hypothetical protein